MKDINTLILENESLIYKIINKYRNYFDIEDLYQVAVIGLIKAYNKYRDGYNAKFITYAYKFILGEVIKYVNDFRSIKVSRDNQILYLKILKAKEILSQKMMKNPTNYDLSLFLEIDEETIEQIILLNSNVDSLDKIISDDSKGIDMYNMWGYYDEQIENYPLKSELDNLSKEERQLIVARFYNDYSQRETGKILGMYQVEVSRKEKKILKKLHDRIVL